MKVLLLLFFSFATPFAIFLATILYGGVTTANLKQALSDAAVYSQINAYLIKKDSQDAEQSDLVSNFVSQRFTPSYIQTKTEFVIDDSSDWVTGKSQKPPVISFKELKQDMIAHHPEILKSIEHVPTEVELQQANVDPEQKEAIVNQAKQMRAFSQNDFTFPIDNQLQGFKSVYEGIKIALPILALVIIATLLMIAKLADGAHSRFKWLAATFLLSGLVGYGIIFLNTLILHGIAHINLLDKSDYAALVAPIVLAIINLYVKVYMNYQGVVSNILLFASAGCFVGVALTRKLAQPAVKPLSVKRSFWGKPTPKKK